MATKITIRTWLPCHIGTLGHHRGASICGVIDRLWINPETRTNDRFQLAAECDPPLATGDYIEFRVFLDGKPHDLITGHKVTVTPDEDGMVWLIFDMISCHPEHLKVGGLYHFELWDRDTRLAHRALVCSMINDRRAPSSW